MRLSVSQMDLLHNHMSNVVSEICAIDTKNQMFLRKYLTKADGDAA